MADEDTPEWRDKAVAVIEADEGGVRVYYGEATPDLTFGRAFNVWYTEGTDGKPSNDRYIAAVKFDDEGYAEDIPWCIVVRYATLAPEQQATIKRLSAQSPRGSYEVWPEQTDVTLAEAETRIAAIRTAIRKLEAAELWRATDSKGCALSRS